MDKHHEPWNVLASSRTFYGFGTAPAPPFAWGIHRTDTPENQRASEPVFRRMMQVWRIPPAVFVRFTEAAETAFARVREVIPPATLTALDKPGFMREIMVPHVGNLFSNDPAEAERPFLLRIDMLRVLLEKLGLLGHEGPRSTDRTGYPLRGLQAVAEGWVYHEIGHLLEANRCIRLRRSAAPSAATDFFGAKLAIVDRNRSWFAGDCAALKTAIDGVGEDIRVERFARWMLGENMDTYFRYIHMIGFYAFDAERVFESPFARHRLMLTLLYDTGLELARDYGNAFGTVHHDRYLRRRDSFLNENPFYGFHRLREIMRIYRDGCTLELPAS